MNPSPASAQVEATTPVVVKTKPPFYKAMYFQVLLGIIAGVLVGHFWPTFAADLKPLGDAFIKLIKMIIGPVVFCTVVSGIAGMRDLRKVGRVGGKALL
jgi:aerobic C4-dicarboxylate transport protein